MSKETTKAAEEALQAQKEGTTPAVLVAPSITVKVKYGKENFDVTLPETSTILNLKQAIEAKTSLLPALQTLMTPKGQLKPQMDTLTLTGAGLADGAKLLLVGSQILDVLALATPPAQNKGNDVVIEQKESLCEQTQHAKVLAGGPPEYLDPGDPSGAQNPIPTSTNREPSLIAMNNKKEKLRVVFRAGGAVVNTNASSFQIQPGSVREVQSEPIPSYPGYHLVTLLLRDSKTKYHFYWVPAQYIQNLRNLLLGW